MFIEALCCSKGMHWWFNVHVNDKRTWKAIELSGSLLYKWSDLRSLRKRALFLEAITITASLVCVVCKRFDATLLYFVVNILSISWRWKSLKRQSQLLFNNKNACWCKISCRCRIFVLSLKNICIVVIEYSSAYWPIFGTLSLKIVTHVVEK